MQQPLDSNSDSNTLEDKLEDDNQANDPFEALAKKEMLGIVRKVLLELSPKEAAILRLRFGLHDDISTKDYVISKEEAKQIAGGKGLT